MTVPRSESTGSLASPAARTALLGALLLCLPSGAQIATAPRLPSLPRPQPGVLDSGDAEMQQKQLRALNKDRQKLLISDTNKLLKLATQLDMQVKADNPQSLTPFQLRQLAEIEKLAHSVKDKMSNSNYGPSAEPPPRGFQNR